MNPEITKIIEQYLAGELSEADQAAFEERLNTREDLREELEKQRRIHEAAKRAYQRQQVKNVGKQYHLKRNFWRGGLSLLVAGIITAGTLFLMQTAADEAIPELTEDVRAQLDELAPYDLEAQYFLIPTDGGVVLSEKGVLISVPKQAFLLNGAPYEGQVTLQFQEALDAADIMRSGLNTMSGDQQLETGGMVSVAGFTLDGKPLDFNPKVGVYVQVPSTNENPNMKLYDGQLKPDGTIDWVNPEELEKLPVPVNMSELDFYPSGYENYLDQQKWKRAKSSRDSLYLSFEERHYRQGQGHQVTVPEPEKLEFGVSNQDYIQFIFVQDEIMEDSTSVAEDVAACAYISPSKVLGFWHEKFNNTNLATRDFEKRMQLIHKTCDNGVLNVYLSKIDEPLYKADEQVVAMGYSEFQSFAAEKVGRVNASNKHLNNLKAFYEKSVKQLKKRNEILQNEEQKRRDKFDEKAQKSRTDERKRRVWREQQAFQEEFEFNLNDVYKQLGKTRGFTIRKSSKGFRTSKRTINANIAVKNIDALVYEATVNRASTEINDPETGKKAQITYNDFSFTVANHDQYLKLYAYAMPYEINSYTRIDNKNGTFSYPLNNDMRYNLAVIGVTENGYAYFQKQNFRTDDLDVVTLEPVSEIKLNASVEQLNRGRTTKPMRITEELAWLSTERANYKEQRLRMEMYAFRQEIREIIFPCCSHSGDESLEGVEAE